MENPSSKQEVSLPPEIGEERLVTKTELAELKLRTDTRLSLLSWGQSQVLNYDDNTVDADTAAEKKQKADSMAKEKLESTLGKLPEDERIIFLEEMITQAQGQLSGARLETERVNEDRVIVRLFRTGKRPNGNQDVNIGEYTFDGARNQIITKEAMDEELQESKRTIRIAVMRIGQDLLSGDTQKIFDHRKAIETAMKKIPAKERIVSLEIAMKEAQGQLSGGRLRSSRPNEGQVRIAIIKQYENLREGNPTAEIVYDLLTNKVEVAEK